jgi:hypothetical protein
MGIYKVSQPMVTNGLVVHLDATNPKSYPGSGNSWFDLSGFNNNGTLSGTTYNTTKLCLSFSTANSSGCIITNSDSVNFNSGTGSFTFDFVVTLTSAIVGTSSCFFMKRSSLGGLGGTKGYQWRLLVNDATTAASIISVDNANGLADTTYAQSQGTLFTTYNRLANYTLTFDTTSKRLDLYTNGVNNNITNNNIMTGSTSYSNSFNLIMGRNATSGSNAIDGDYYIFKAYNRVLSPLEVQQNFNAIRGRFNL